MLPVVLPLSSTDPFVGASISGHITEDVTVPVVVGPICVCKIIHINDDK